MQPGSATSLGAQLRLAREARGISLREISDQTRISIRYLEGIEADDYTHLPGGIFNRSFVRAYAKQVGFDEKEALAIYARTLRERGESPNEISTPQRPRVYTDGNSTRSPVVTALLTIFILATLSLAALAALNWYQRRTGNQVNDPQSSPATGSGPETNVQHQPTSVPPPLPSPSFNIQIKAKGEPVWFRARTDEGESVVDTLAAETSREFAPERRLTLQYAKVKAKAGALEVTINGRPARPPITGPQGKLAEMVITKEDYQQFLQ